MERPVTLKNRVGFGQENTSEHVRKDNVQCDQASTERNVACDVGTLDFRIQGLLHNTVEKRVRTRSWVDKSDWEPSSPRWTEGRFKAGPRLQRIQWEFEENDPRHK